jgi:GDP-L-fucose synthase
MVGSALMRRLAGENCALLTASHAELDLRRQADVEAWMTRHRPQAIFVAAATVGGILANDTRPAEFLYDNLLIEANIVHAARASGAEKVLLLGSACVYPRLASQPMREEALLTGPLEPTNRWYAIAKISGMMLCQAYRAQYGCDFISAMPNNLYGPGDNFDLESSHVIPALIRKVHEAKLARAETVTVWGTGAPLREFLYVDDLADALVFLMQRYSDDLHINVGTGEELSIRDLAMLVAEAVGWQGRLVFDTSRPDGMPRKLVDVSRLQALGWRAQTPLREGLSLAYAWYLKNGARTAPAPSMSPTK